MGHLIADLELTEPLGEVRLRADEDGIALLLRAHGRPVYYGLHALAPGARLRRRRAVGARGRPAARLAGRPGAARRRSPRRRPRAAPT